MKIGILTFHSSINNGAVIQCFSLVNRLKKEFSGVVVEVIDYQLPTVEKSYEESISSYLEGFSPVLKVKRLAALVRNPNLLKWRRERKLAFESVREVLPLSKEKIFDGDQKRLFDLINEKYDVVIAGSDAIWNYSLRGFPNPYFLSNQIAVPMFSYAASCYGMCYEDIPESEKTEIRKILDQYAFLGVRDSESENFVRFIGSNHSYYHTCDPTVFLDISQLPVDENCLRKKLRDRGFLLQKNAIAVMGNDALVRMVRSMYGDSYQIVALYNYSKYADVNLHDITPYEWAYAFRYYALTFTTFFHGTLLSLRNGTPVICVALDTNYSKSHKTKVLDFLERIDMADCYFHTDYVTKGVPEIKEKADSLLELKPTKQILKKMDTEAKCSDKFIEALRETFDKGDTNNG